jgi:hypothetical protein
VHSRRTFGIARLQIIKAFPQSHRIQLANDKGPIAALRASLAAHQPITTLARSLSQGGIHNLDKLLIGKRKGSTHISSI